MFTQMRQAAITYQLLSYCQEKTPAIYQAILAGRITKVIDAIVTANIALLEPHEVYSQYNSLHRVLSDSVVLLLERLNDLEFQIETQRHIFDIFVTFSFISDSKQCKIELNKNVCGYHVDFFIDSEKVTVDKIWSN